MADWGGGISAGCKSANCGSNYCSLMRAIDGRIVRCDIISSCQSAATSEIVKRFWLCKKQVLDLLPITVLEMPSDRFNSVNRADNYSYYALIAVSTDRSVDPVFWREASFIDRGNLTQAHSYFRLLLFIGGKGEAAIAFIPSHFGIEAVDNGSWIVLQSTSSKHGRPSCY